MGVFSGKYGVVNQMTRVRNWVLNETTSPARYRASNTKGGTGRAAGTYDFTGSFEGYGGVPPVMPSEYFDFAGYTAPTTGAYGTNGVTKSANYAIVESVTINWSWETGDLLDWVVNFAAGQPLIITEATGSDTDTANFDPPLVCGTKVTLTEANTVWPNITRASLTILAENPSYVNSSTSGKTGRRPGVIDWNAAITEQATGEFASLNADACLGSKVGGDNVLRMWIDATTYWDLHMAHHANTSDLRVDLDTGDIVAQTHNFEMTGIDTGNTLGHVGRPGESSGSYWWPDVTAAATLPF